jgi:hypothetical protein
MQKPRRAHPQGFGARPPQALQRPNCKRISISQRHRVLGSCCGRGARAPGRCRVYPAPRASAGVRSAPASGAATPELQAYQHNPSAVVHWGVAAGGAPALRDAGAFTRPREHPQGFGARPPRALQRPNCKRVSISQRNRVLGSWCGRGARAPGRWRVHAAPALRDAGAFTRPREHPPGSERARLGRCNVRSASVSVWFELNIQPSGPGPIRSRK